MLVQINRNMVANVMRFLCLVLTVILADTSVEKKKIYIYQTLNFGRSGNRKTVLYKRNLFERIDREIKFASQENKQREHKEEEKDSLLTVKISLGYQKYKNKKYLISQRNAIYFSRSKSCKSTHSVSSSSSVSSEDPVEMELTLPVQLLSNR